MDYEDDEDDDKKEDRGPCEARDEEDRLDDNW
jgi:hypothetical protein